MPELQWSEKDIAAAGIPAANLDAIKKAYFKLSEKEQTEAARAREKQMKALEKLANTLAPKLRIALEKTGVDLKKLDLQLQDLQKKPSAEKFRKIEQSVGENELELQKELAAAGINEAAVVEKLLSIIGPSPADRVERRGLFTIVVTSTSPKGFRDTKNRKTGKEK